MLNQKFLCTDIYPFFSPGDPNGPDNPAASPGQSRLCCIRTTSCPKMAPAPVRCELTSTYAARTGEISLKRVHFPQRWSGGVHHCSTLLLKNGIV